MNVTAPSTSEPTLGSVTRNTASIPHADHWNRNASPGRSVAPVRFVASSSFMIGRLRKFSSRVARYAASAKLWTPG